MGYFVVSNAALVGLQTSGQMSSKLFLGWGKTASYSSDPVHYTYWGRDPHSKKSLPDPGMSKGSAEGVTGQIDSRGHYTTFKVRLVCTTDHDPKKGGWEVSYCGGSPRLEHLAETR